MKRRFKILGVLVILMCGRAFCQITQASATVKTINTAAAVNCLNKATEAFSAEQWNTAVFYADLGIAYDASIADFYYITAVCYAHQDRSVADQLKFVEDACLPDFSWRYYNKNDAALLCASLYARTKRYNEALAILQELDENKADIDYVRLLCYYGLGKKAEARNLVAEALDKWAFDFRFAAAFLYNEKDVPKTNISKVIAKKIITRSYVWENSNPEILVLLAPFESDSSETIRRLKMYREMYARFTGSYTPQDLYVRSYALLLSLQYRLISEKTAVEEFFDMDAMFTTAGTETKIKAKAFFAPHLEQLCRVIVDENLRATIARNIVSYRHCIFTGDEYANPTTIIFYESGRPSRAIIDMNADNQPDITVTCNFGIPTEITSADNTTIRYDEYPQVRQISVDQVTYVMRPATLVYKPVTLQPLNLGLFNIASAYSNLYIITKNETQPELSKKTLVKAAVYVTLPSSLIPEAYDKVLLNKGEALSSQTFVGESVVANAQYKNGIIRRQVCDRDGDGYFETVRAFDKQGNLELVKVDINRDTLYEYTEKHESDGTVQKMWDSNEDGKWEVLYIQKGDYASVQWVHPITHEIVQVEYKDNLPTTISYLGVQKDLVPNADNSFFWVGEEPTPQTLSNEIRDYIIKYFNQSACEIVSYSVSINGFNIFAVKSEGVIFAQIISR